MRPSRFSAKRLTVKAFADLRIFGIQRQLDPLNQPLDFVPP